MFVLGYAYIYTVSSINEDTVTNFFYKKFKQKTQILFLVENCKIKTDTIKHLSIRLLTSLSVKEILWLSGALYNQNGYHYVSSITKLYIIETQ